MKDNAEKQEIHSEDERVLLAFRLSKVAHKQLRYLAGELDKTQQRIFEEAFNDYFRKYGKSASVDDDSKSYEHFMRNLPPEEIATEAEHLAFMQYVWGNGKGSNLPPYILDRIDGIAQEYGLAHSDIHHMAIRRALEQQLVEKFMDQAAVKE